MYEMSHNHDSCYMEISNVSGCARDKKMYENLIQHICLGNGNYNREQYTNNGTRYCVDADGFLDDNACPDSPVQCQ
jgi:hypothetical protein